MSEIIQKLENKKIKICHISSVDITLKFVLLPNLIFLKNQGYQVYAVCSPGKWIKDIKKEKIKVKTIRFKRKISLISDLIAFVKLFFYFKKEKFQIVHTHTLKPEFWAQIAAKIAGIPIIINTIHGFDFGEESSFLKKKFFIILEKIAAICSDLIFSVSRAVIRTAVKEKICKPNLIKYWGGSVNVSRFNPKRFSQNFVLEKKKQFGIALNSRVVGIVARLVEEKGYLELFQAFRKVLDKFPNTLLLIIGFKEPEKKDAINPEIVKKYNIQNNVIFLEERTDIDELYSLMDIFVLPTHREGVGASILEASAMERPVIVNNTGGCPEAVDDGKTGILVPLKNVEKLYEAIIYLFDNPEKAREMGRLGRRKILKEFNETLVFDRIKTEYQRLIKEKL